MPLYLLLFGLFIVQEPVSTDAILLEAYQYHYNVWIIHLLFIIATLLDIVVGYAIGKWLQRRFSENKVMQRFVHWARSVSGPGTYGQYLFLFVWSTVLFPFSAVLAPWLDIPFWRTLVCMFIGDLVLWYGVEWLVVLGVKTFVPDPIDALYGVVAASLLLALLMRYLKRGE
jgi:membrane protein YqaA with SNARE-associated domain